MVWNHLAYFVEWVERWSGKIALIAASLLAIWHTGKRIRKQFGAGYLMLDRFVRSAEDNDRLLARVDAQDSLIAVLLAVIPNPIWRADAKGNCVYANDACLRLVKRPFSQISGQGWLNSIVGDDRPGVIHVWEEAVADRAPFYLEFRMRDSDRQTFQVALSGQPITNSRREIEYLNTLTLLKEE